MFTKSFAHQNAVSNLDGIVGDLRNQDDVRTTGDAGLKRNPSSVSAHDFHNEDAPVAFRSRMKLVERITRSVYSRVETKRNDCSVQVVVDRFGNSDDRDPFVIEISRRC